MKTPERFDRAIKALVKGYMNGTLAKGTCSACAVGNMIAECMSYEIQKDVGCFMWNTKAPAWDDVFCTSNSGIQSIDYGAYEGEAKKEIDSTGYSWIELARVEKAFERNTRINYKEYPVNSTESIDQDQLNGLHAVVDVLCEIDGVRDSKVYKDMFVKEVI